MMTAKSHAAPNIMTARSYRGEPSRRSITWRDEKQCTKKVIFVGSKSAVPLPHTGVKPRDDLPGSPFLRTNRDAKCLGPSFPDTFGPRSADFTGLKMIRITRGASSFDHLVSDREHARRDCEADRFRCLQALTDGLGVDAAFDAIGGEATALQALDGVAPGGRAVLVGIPAFAVRAPISGTYYGSVRPDVDF